MFCLNYLIVCNYIYRTLCIRASCIEDVTKKSWEYVIWTVFFHINRPKLDISKCPKMLSFRYTGCWTTPWIIWKKHVFGFGKYILAIEIDLAKISLHTSTNFKDRKNNNKKLSKNVCLNYLIICNYFYRSPCIRNLV